jgi:hypothetical protein
MLACRLYGKDKEMMMTPSLERPEESASPSPSARLRHWMQQGMVVAPFVYNSLQVKMAQLAGLQAVYRTGFGTAACSRCNAVAAEHPAMLCR